MGRKQEISEEDQDLGRKSERDKRRKISQESRKAHLHNHRQFCKGKVLVYIPPLFVFIKESAREIHNYWQLPDFSSFSEQKNQFFRNGFLNFIKHIENFIITIELLTIRFVSFLTRVLCN